MKIVVDDREAKVIQERLDHWLKGGLKKAIQGVGGDLRDQVVSNWERGLDGAGKSMPAVKDSTMGMPIRYGSDPRIRRTVNPDPERVVYATGQTAKGLVSRNIPDGVEIINPDYEDQMKLQVNAAGRKNTPKRDPMVVGEHLEQMVNEALLADFDKRVGV
jgi:hypothetical protein